MSRYTIFALLMIFLHSPAPLSCQERMLTDDLGYVHVLKRPPQRIVSLAPNVTEILFVLGLEKKIVGVTRYCNYPKQAQKKQRIGGMVDLDLEKIISLQPDLVIAFRGNPLQLIHRLKDLQLSVFVLEQGTTLESVFSLIKRIGLVTDREKAAASLVNTLNKDYKRVLDRLASVKQRPKVYINIHGKGLWTCGRDSFLNDLVIKAKGLNIAGKTPRAWIAYNLEEIIHQNPEYIIVITKSKKDFNEIKEWFTQDVPLGSIQAIKRQNIYYLDEDLITRPGPRIFLAFEQLSRILHPSIFRNRR
jgi:iron complex transport system substrate-binding protein